MYSDDVQSEPPACRRGSTDKGGWRICLYLWSHNSAGAGGGKGGGFGAAGQQNIYVEQDLFNSTDATGSSGSGRMPMMIGAGYANNAGGAMQVPFVQAGAAPQIQECIQAAAGECSLFDSQ